MMSWKCCRRAAGNEQQGVPCPICRLIKVEEQGVSSPRAGERAVNRGDARKMRCEASPRGRGGFCQVTKNAKLFAKLLRLFFVHLSKKSRCQPGLGDLWRCSVCTRSAEWRIDHTIQYACMVSLAPYQTPKCNDATLWFHIPRPFSSKQKKFGYHVNNLTRCREGFSGTN